VESQLRTELFVGGKFASARSGETLASVNPHDGSTLAEVSMAGAADVQAAVESASAAFPRWSRASAAERGRLLLALADAIEANAGPLAQLESLDTGHPLRDTRGLDVPRTAATFRYFGGMADKHEGSVIPVDPGFLNYTLRQPIGIVGQIVPWNFPLMFTSWKMAPALAAGNCVILKPSELTPLTSLKIAELMAEVGFPPGVVSILPGTGAGAGAAIVAHPQIAKLSFTGSTAVGRSIASAAGTQLKRLQLELGGKGANIVFADADLDEAVNGAAFAIFHNQGQACIAGSRILVHESIADAFLEKLLRLARSIRLGNPLDARTEMGPLTSLEHRDRVLRYVGVAREQGSEVLCGGVAPDREELARGYYVEPTLVTARPADRVAQEEVFGPFAVVMRFEDDETALSIANGTTYGLGAGLWTRDLQRAHRFASALRSGMVWINCYKRANPGSPFGGVGSSGYGREMGFEVMREYTEVKSVWVNVDASIPPYYPR